MPLKTIGTHSKKNSRLYNALNTWLGQPSPWAHKAHLTVCLWMVVAKIHSGEVNLTRWISYLPCLRQYAHSKHRRVRRWLNNPRINVHRLYKPLIQAALVHWQQECLYLSLDTSLFWDEYCQLPCGSGLSGSCPASGVGYASPQQCYGFPHATTEMCWT
ncbi:MULTISPECIES: hypothetical protein [Moorena]|uniref:hypothetical protein n=1 Tax=Moorena TaxID=1155738 RepID=UPI0010549AC8|nr:MULTISPECIES: hypothetical protein [Moorena]NEP66249.1 hypothetical protein [Moorena sp. SIO3A5]